MSNLLPVNIVIGDRTYRIKIDPANEEIVRKTLKTINDKILEFKTQFAGKNMQDYIAMVLIWYATEIITGNDIAATAALQQQMIQIEKMIDQSLQGNVLE
jgi:Cell division protein ZapA